MTTNQESSMDRRTAIRRIAEIRKAEDAELFFSHLPGQDREQRLANADRRYEERRAISREFTDITLAEIQAVSWMRYLKKIPAIVVMVAGVIGMLCPHADALTGVSVAAPATQRVVDYGCHNYAVSVHVPGNVEEYGRTEINVLLTYHNRGGVALDGRQGTWVSLVERNRTATTIRIRNLMLCGPPMGWYAVNGQAVTYDGHGNQVDWNLLTTVRTTLWRTR